MFDFQKGLFLDLGISVPTMLLIYIFFEMNWKMQYFTTLVQILKAVGIIDLEQWTLECFIVFPDGIIPS